jgi:Type II secretion system (T2SS), protein E, N-terminal domain
VSSSELPPFGEAGGLRPPDTDERTATAANGSPEVSPELVLVDSAMTDDGQTPAGPEREVPMSSNPSPDGMFFVDQQPPAAPEPAPVAAVTPVAPAPSAEAPAEVAPVVGGAMRDVPLGTLIFRAGLLAEEQLEDALQEGMRTGKRLGEVLAARGLIKDTDLGRLLAGQQGLPYVEATTLAVDPAAMARLPENIARLQNALAFAFEDGTPVVAVADPTNELVVENVRRALGVEPRLVVAAHGELARKIQESYSQPPQPAPAPVEAPAPPAEAAAPVEAPAPAAVEQPAVAPVAEAAAPEAAPAQAVTPMPTTVPPAEERAPEPEVVQPVEPSVVKAEVPPLHAQAAAEPPLAPEPVAPPPVAAPAPAAPPAEPVAPAPAAPPPAEQPAAEPVVIVAETPPAAPEQPVAAPEQPAEPGLFVQAAEQALAPQAPEPAPEPPAPEPAAQAEPTHSVVLRLTDEDRVEIGAFGSQEEAESFARTVVGRISRAEEQAEWPLFGDRFIRPQGIVSVDVVERSGASWTGSQTRARWAEAPEA